MSDRLTILFNKHIAGQLTAEERVELMGLFLEPSLQERLKELVADAWNVTGEDYGLPEEKMEHMIKIILESEKMGSKPLVARDEPGRRFIMNWKRWMAAASIITLLGVGGYLLFFKQRDLATNPPVATTQQEIEAPKTHKARITLANGSKVDLDSMQNGQIALQGSMRLVKLDNGKIVYETMNGNPTYETQYNTLENPRGSRVINMMLSDGSHIWLNAGSSVTYPVVFTNRERAVRVSGEAYFEVARDAQRPFKVTKDEIEIKVLGTHFNVNAYDDEPDLKVTLLEGSIRVSKAQNANLLRPGEQAQIKNDIKIISGIDVDEVMAWKNGLFSFRGASMEELMRQLARWYDVNVVYEGKIPDRKFGGKIHKDANITEVLKILEESNVHYRINNKDIVILP